MTNKQASPNDHDILDPINIARARHASAYKPSIAQQPKKANVKQPSQTVTTAANIAAQTQKKQIPATSELSSCLVIAVLGFVFFVGSLIGGIAGGGLTLMATGNSDQLSFIGATPTPSPSPSPAPVATVTPTPTIPPLTRPIIEDVLSNVMRSVVTVINNHDPNYHINDEGRVVGSGVIIDNRGYIATNNHVVKNPGQLSVVLFDGREIEAQLIAQKEERDLAVLKISLINLQIVQWADSSKARPGQTVYAVGSPLGDFPNSVSIGIISGLNRALEMDGYVIDNLIQTDAAINRGSSGGPLINTIGDVVGLNTFIIRESEERGIAEGIAFAIPAQNVMDFVLPVVTAHSAEAEVIPTGN